MYLWMNVALYQYGIIIEISWSKNKFPCQQKNFPSNEINSNNITPERTF